MRVLLDTHTFLWWNSADLTLSQKAASVLADPKNELLLSVVSCWELTIKFQANKLKLPEPPSIYIPTRTAHYGIEILPLTAAHVLALETVPMRHRDPFDRMLVAQAKTESLPIVTVDEDIRGYPVKTIW